MARTLQFEQESLPAETGRQARALGQALQALADGLNAAAAGGARARGVLQSLPATVQAAARPLQTALNPALGALGALVRGAADGTDRLAALLGGQTAPAAQAASRAVEQVGRAAKTTARAADKAARSLAGFDEIERLAAADAADTTLPDAGGTGGGSGGAGPGRPGGSAAPGGLPGALAAALGAVQAFWQQVQALYAPAIEAWRAAWAQLQAAALAVWGPVQAAALGLWQNALAPLAAYLGGTFLPGVWNSLSQAFAPILSGAAATAVTQLGTLFTTLATLVSDAVNNVLGPLLALALQMWQGAMGSIQAAWTAYGQPILAGAAQAVQNLCTIFMTLWSGTVQPVLQALITQLSQLWNTALQPLFDALTLAMGSVMNLLLTFWNTLLAPLLNFLAASFGPVAAQVFSTLAEAVRLAVQTAAGLLTSLLQLLRGLADFLTQGLLGNWTAGWQAMTDSAAAAWRTITDTVRGAIQGLQTLIANFARGIADAVANAWQALSGLGRGASGLGRVYKTGRSAAVPYAAVPALASPPRLPALAAGAVIPPNRAFLALLGDQRQGTNIEAPLDTLRQAFTETLAGFAGQDQTINIYLGEELLDSVIASSQSRRMLRSGGR